MRKLKTTLYMVAGFFVLGFFQNCGYVGQSAPEKFMSSLSNFSTTPTYAELYSSIFSSKCLACHNSGPVNFTSYATLMAGGSVVPFNASSSELFKRVAAGDMPVGGPVLSASDQKAIQNWIQAGATSDDSPPVSVPPNPPTGVAVIALSATSSMLTWNLPAQTINNVKVYRSLSNSGSFAEIVNLAGDAISYTDSTLMPTTTYYYKLTTSNNDGISIDSSIVNVTTPSGAPVTTAPTAPSNLLATAASSSQINLSWTDNSNNESGFKIECALSANGTYTLVATAPANATSYQMTGLAPSTSYFYRISSTNSIGSSAKTSSVAATTQSGAAPMAPTQPTGLAATATSSSQINLSWTDTSNDESGFKIERSTTSGGPYTQIATTAAGATSYQNTGLTAATTYYYRISSTNATGSSAATASVSATTQAASNSNATFAWIKTNVVDTKCISCHGSNGSGGFDFRTYAGVMKGVKAGNSSGSRFYSEINTGSMPRGGPTLPAASITNIKNWIDAGALNN